MITGRDSVWVFAGDPAAVVGRFLTAWSQTWPGMVVAVGRQNNEPFVPWDDRTVRLSPGTEEVLVARDLEMTTRWDEDGYASDATGLGPFAIYYRPYARRTTEMLALQDPYEHDFVYEPYPVVVVGAGLSLLTIVTPDDAGAFRQTIAQHLIDQVR